MITFVAIVYKTRHNSRGGGAISKKQFQTSVNFHGVNFVDLSDKLLERKMY